LLERANQAEGYIIDILCHPDLRELGIEEPHGYLGSNIQYLIKLIESKLEAL